LPIVILDPQQHASIARARLAPHVQRVDHVTEMQVAGRRRGKPRDDCFT
jgi:hypothetical protein